MELKVGDVVEIEYDMYANEKLVQTSHKEKGDKEGLNSKDYSGLKIIIGKNMFLPKFEDALTKGKQGSKKTLKLKCEDAFGKRDKNLIRTFPKSAFTKHKLRAVVGMVYNFSNMLGVVKSVNGGRVLVDFNHPFAGKDISITYKVTKKIEDIKEQIELVLTEILKLPKKSFNIKVIKKEVSLFVPKELTTQKEFLEKTIRESLIEFDEYKFKCEEIK